MEKSMVDIAIKVFETTILGGVLLVVLYGIWRAVAWLGTDIIKPIKERVLSHIDTLDTATKSMERTVEMIREAVVFQGDAIERQSEVLKIAAATDVEQSEKIDRIDRNVDEIKQKANLFFGQQSREYHDRHPNEARKMGS